MKASNSARHGVASRSFNARDLAVFATVSTLAIISVTCLISSGAPAWAQSAVPETPPVLSPREVVERSAAAVVMIEAEREDQIRQGSGFLVRGDGAIVTGLHVIDNASSVTVSFPDGTRIEDVVVDGFDVEKDLAVLQVEIPAGDTEPTVVALGKASSTVPGEKILVIGNPLGLEQTVTDGIVSAWREPREPEFDDQDKLKTEKLLLPPSRLIQISAAISPGSSGGPVFNDRGEVIGVAIAGVLYGVAGLNFAVPVDDLPALLEEGEAMDLETFCESADYARIELAQPHFEMAEIAYEQDERQRAQHHLERALLLFPRYEEALLLSGRMMLQDGQLELAEQRLTDAVEADGESAEAWYLLGNLYDRLAPQRPGAGLLVKAEAAYEKALDLDYGHAHAAFHLAVIKVGQGIFDRAEELLLAAIDFAPGLCDARYMLGEVYLRHGNVNKAKEAFEGALWEDRDHALSHFGLAKLYTMVEQTPHGTVAPHGSGTHHWEEFLRLSEDDPSLAEVRQVAVTILRKHLPHLLNR